MIGAQPQWTVILSKEWDVSCEIALQSMLIYLSTYSWLDSGPIPNTRKRAALFISVLPFRLYVFSSSNAFQSESHHVWNQ
jgi:hypothetical protein